MTGLQRVRQHAIGVCQTLTNDGLGKTGAIDLEQLLEIAQTDAITGRDCGNVEISFTEMRGDVSPNGCHPRAECIFRTALHPSSPSYSGALLRLFDSRPDLSGERPQLVDQGVPGLLVGRPVQEPAACQPAQLGVGEVTVGHRHAMPTGMWGGIRLRRPQFVNLS
jgi:hypothetical protein